MSVKNTCSPESIFGDLERYMFLGCSVMSFSCSQGWNNQGSEVTVSLVKDTCLNSGDRYYYDANLTRQTWTDADPGFYGLTYDIVGAPVYFRMGNFEYAGLVQSWEEMWSDSEFPVYQVKIVDPRQLLENTQIIINEYAGNVGSIYNLINAYGYMETQGSVNCPEVYQSSPGNYAYGNGVPDGAVFGSPAEKYGGADVNDNGMQWTQILNATRVLLCSYPINSDILDWSAVGRIAFKAPPSIGDGFGLMAADSGNLAYYFLDLEDVPVAPSYWRLNGISVSAIDAISQIMEDSGHDFYVELVPVIDPALGSGVHKFIKIRAVNRKAGPALNAIDTFIAGKNVLDYKKGRELRNETTQSIVIGGPKQNYYQVEQSDDPEGDGQPTPEELDDMIIPYFGLDPSTGNVIIPEKDNDGWWEFEAPSIDLANQLTNDKYNRIVASTLTINEKELIMALSGFDEWASYAARYNTDLYQALDMDIVGIFDPRPYEQAAQNIDVQTNKFRPADIIRLPQVFSAVDNKDYEVQQIGYSWISKIAQEYYGKKYQVRLPFTCGKLDSESGIVQLSEEPSDGGWTEVTPILGLSHPSVYTDFFSLEDNRLGSFCRFDDGEKLETTGLDINDFVKVAGGDNKLWIKTTVDPEFVYVNKTNLTSPRVVINLPVSIYKVDDEEIGVDAALKLKAGFENLVTNFRTNGVVDNAKAKEVREVLEKGVGAILAHIVDNGRAKEPDAAGFGIKSNVLTYGPWGAGTTAGGVNVVQDEGLVPWEYGGFTDLNDAGDQTALEGITNNQVDEEGSVTVPGYPELPLGAELLAADSGGPFYGGAENLLENRLATLNTVNSEDTFSLGIYVWDGTFGPNVTSVDVTVDQGNVITRYGLRTWTPKYGKFEKYNANVLKSVGQNKIKQQKQIRAFNRNRLNAGFLNSIDRKLGDKSGMELQKGILTRPATPHECFVGELNPWNSGEYTRPIVASESIPELGIEVANNFSFKAFMSLDGLLRPVSMDGAGNFPRYIQPTIGCSRSISRQILPPFYTPEDYGTTETPPHHNNIINVDYLNPFSNPSGFNRSLVVQDRCDTKDTGHDIEILGRGVMNTGFPSSTIRSSMIMPIEGYSQGDLSTSDYRDDYRAFALRGPLLLQSWGYDIDGFPVPNKVDSTGNATIGQFASTNLECKFMDDWLRKSESWPVAPIDLRLDRERGVWTIPQGYAEQVVGLKQCLTPYSSVSGVILQDPFDYRHRKCDGTAAPTAVVTVSDVIGYYAPSGSLVIASYDNSSRTNCGYIVKSVNPLTGITVHDSETCIHTSSMEYDDFGPCTNFVNDITFGRGITVKNSEFYPNKLEIGAGFKISGSSPSGTIVCKEMEYVPFSGEASENYFNKLTAINGLYVSGLNCDASIGAKPVLVEGVDTTGGSIKSGFCLGGGLKFGQCFDISSNLDVEDNPINGIVEVNLKGSSDMPDGEEIEVVTRVRDLQLILRTLIAPSGGGFIYPSGSVEFYVDTAKLKFSSCGTYKGASSPSSYLLKSAYQATL